MHNIDETIKKIKRLKAEKDAIILAHYYQPLEIQSIADFVGDSFGLSVKAKDAKEKLIVFCGVYFMAETAKILSPEKTVLSPDTLATCPMANMVTEEDIEKLRSAHPGAPVVCYVNTTARVKAVSDVCVTSSSAQKIISKLDAPDIIFVPDKNMGKYLQETTDKNIFYNDGYCYVHDRFSANNLQKVKDKYPRAKVLVHPECPWEVIELADEALSTSGMIKYVENSEHDIFVIGTEQELLERLKVHFPEKTFLSTGFPGFCINMKKIKLHDVHNALLYEQHKVELADNIIKNASKSLLRMIELNK